MALFSLLLGLGSVEMTAEEGAKSTASRGVVLVELFTSQGCSSCPPADRYLTELAAREDLEIIPLSFHVDYWNYIGWTDPFSSPVWSDRQRRYAHAFGGNRVYTPQMVVNGRWEGVGSDRREVARFLERAGAEARQAELSLEAEWPSKEQLRVLVNLQRLDSVLEELDLKIWVAIVESELETAVGRGENASKRLRNDRVVRRLDQLPSRSGERTLDVALDDRWRRDRLSVVAFLQDSESLQVYAATERALAP